MLVIVLSADGEPEFSITRDHHVEPDRTDDDRSASSPEHRRFQLKINRARRTQVSHRERSCEHGLAAPSTRTQSREEPPLRRLASEDSAAVTTGRKQQAGSHVVQRIRCARDVIQATRDRPFCYSFGAASAPPIDVDCPTMNRGPALRREAA